MEKDKYFKPNEESKNLPAEDTQPEEEYKAGIGEASPQNVENKHSFYRFKVTGVFRL